MHTWSRLASVIALVCPLLASAQGGAPLAERVGGEWVFEMDGDGQPQRVVVTVRGDTLSGSVYGQSFVGGLRGDRLSFVVGDYRWRATLVGDTLTGWLGIGSDSSRWRGTRFRRPAVARRLTLAPVDYHRSLSATVAPAMRIAPGDTVRTSTVDAGGWGRGAFGERGNKKTMGGNPLTGPFYVEGAVPGDVLVVTLLRVRLNRDWAFSGTSLMENAIEPGYAAERKSAQQDNKWVLDTAALVARLASPPPALAGYVVPVRPFLGAIAAAPSREASPSTRESGAYGGNLEYARLREGATVHLPVNVLGAFLYLGDGHAAQGDGEVTGDAMETSLDVEFTVDIRRWGFATMTRAEDVESIMSLGVGGSLDEAMRRATTDMARWLEQGYKLTSTEAALVMGMSLAFDVRDVVSPDYGVTARVPKSVLRQLRPATP